MCGITGFACLSGLPFGKESAQEKIKNMTGTLAHRGPDAEEIFLEEKVALGHRRLAVVDIEGGRQPMTREHEGQRCTIVYNGELYNTQEVREELEALGYHHTTHSDTETVLLSYMAWGENCPQKLNGIFAFGVFDHGARQLFLVRDRFGVKPLFYAVRENIFLFASELKGLLASGLVAPEIDGNGLAEIFGLFPSRTPGNGIYKDVQEVLPGYCGIWDGQWHAWPYWRLQAREHTDSLRNTIEKVRFLVVDAIERQLVSDVPLCTFLSGGLDSSAITAVAALHFAKQGKQLHTYSIDYAGNDQFFHKSAFQPDQDTPFAELMSARFQTKHHFYISDSGQSLCDALEAATLARDLPGMADVDSSLLLFCREIKKDFTVALSGECADEIFGGYPWFHTEKAFKTPNFPWIRENNERDSILNPELATQINASAYVRRRYEESIARAPKLAKESSEEKRRREIQILNLDWFMANLLERKDRMSMACGLEVRVPFCDHRIVEYAYNIPWEYKALEGREKGLLREALKGLLPEEILFRKKSPYPKTHNPLYEEAVKKVLLERLEDPACPLLPLIQKEELLRLSRQSADYGQPWFGQLMARPQLYAFLLQTDFWLRHYGVRLLV